MRIVNYHPRARVGDGGITNSVRRLSEALAEEGAEPVIAYDGTGRPTLEAGVRWWPVRHVGSGQLRIPLDLAPALEGSDVVVLNSAWSGGNVRAGAVARRTGTPYVLAPRGAYDPLIVARRRVVKRVWWTLLERRLVAGAAAVHVFFDDQRGDVDALGYDGDVVYLGRFDPEHKGIDLLLEAVASMPIADRPELRLHGPDWAGGKAKVVELVDRLEVGAHVTVGGAVYGDEKWELIVRSVGLVYPSRWEGFGNSLAEAAALGVPTLATPYPLARFLADRGACLVVEAAPASLADGLRALPQEQSRAMGARARQVVIDELRWEAVARRWLEQLEQLDVRSRRLG